jgi:hypothetical protein
LALLLVAGLLGYVVELQCDAAQALTRNDASSPEAVLNLLSLAFAGRTDGILLASYGPPAGGNCSLRLYTTSNGATTWSAPLVLRRGRSVCAVNLGGQPPGAVEGRRWWLAFAGSVFSGTLDSNSFSTTALPPSASGDEACTLVARGTTL